MWKRRERWGKRDKEGEVCKKEEGGERGGKENFGFENE